MPHSRSRAASSRATASSAAAERGGRRLGLGLGLLAAAVIAYGLSFAAPAAVDYTTEDAEQYQEVADRVHSLTVEAGLGQGDPTLSRRLADARNEYLAASEKLQSARKSKAAWGPLFRYLSTGLAVGGIGLLVADARRQQA